MGIQVSPVAVHTVVSGDRRGRLMCRGHIVTALEKAVVGAGGSRVIEPLGNVPAGEMTSALGAYPRLSLGRCRCDPVVVAVISVRGSSDIEEQKDHEFLERA